MAERSDLIIILDRSGSMEQGRADHEGGLRSFVRDSQALAGDLRLTFVRFDSNDPCEVVFEARPIREVKQDDLILVPRGGTPLLDAVGESLTRFGTFPGPVICMVITDGQENQSLKWTKDGVQKLVKDREAAGWKVLYLGANVDEFAEAGALGVGAFSALGYVATTGGINSAYGAAFQNMSTTYSARATGQSWNQAMKNMNWTQLQRTASKTDDKETK